MITQIKILKGIAPVLVGVREKRTTYITNRALKAFDLFVCLKSTTTAGHIKNYPAQFSALLKLSKVSKATFYKRMQLLYDMKLITVEKFNIHLASWEKLAELYEIPTVEFHTINYDTDNEKQTIEYILKAIEIAENQKAQTVQAQRKLIKTPEIENVFNSHCMLQNKQADFTLKNLHTAQRETYSVGAADYDVLHSVNADINRSAMSIKRGWNFHSIRNVAYLKRQLVERGLAEVTHRVAPVCRYEKTPEKSERGTVKTVGVIAALLMPNIITAVASTQKKKGSKSGAYTTFYSKKNHARIWRLPDNIELNTQLFTK